MTAALLVGVEEVPLAGMETENSPHFQTHKTSDEALSHPGYMLKNHRVNNMGEHSQILLVNSLLADSTSIVNKMVCLTGSRRNLRHSAKL